MSKNDSALIFPVVTHTVHSNARTGIQTVTRNLSTSLMEVIETTPLAWHARRGYLHGLKPDWVRNLHASNIPETLQCSLRNPRNWLVWLLSNGRHSHAPLHLHPSYRDRLQGSWLLMPELMNGNAAQTLVRYARRHRMKVAAIFHDAIPLLRPDLTERTSAAHEDYMRALAKFDLVLGVSEARGDFRNYLQQWNVRVPPVHVCALPEEVPLQTRSLSVEESSRDTIKILCVSTLEPRKNHRPLIESFLVVRQKHPELKLELHLVGDSYPARPEIEKHVVEALARDNCISWHKNVAWKELRKLYSDCSFTVYPSILEGFGLPIVESLWFAKPCLCANFGVMAESARGGGCVTTDVRDKQALGGAIEKLALDRELRTKLTEQAIRRTFTTWREYAGKIVNLLRNAES